MIPFDKCPVCCGELVEKEVEKLIRGGNNTAIIKVKAEVCTGCGERLYSKNQILFFEEIRDKLEKQDTSDLELIGNTFKVAI